MDGYVTNAERTLERKLEYMRRAMGPFLLNLLFEPDVTDILLNAPEVGEAEGTLWVVRLGQDPKRVGTMDGNQAEMLIGAVADSLGAVATRDHAIVEGKLLLDGSRFEGVVPPVAAFPIFAIRRKASAIFPLAHYVEAGSMTQRQMDIIDAAILSRLNIIVTGGTGSGKTTLLNGLILRMSELSPTHRFAIVEDTGEVQCAATNKVILLADMHHPMRRLIQATLRMFPDRIIVGEVRGAEAQDMLMAWNTGHDGGAGTIHSNIISPGAALGRLADMVSMSPDAPANPERLIGEAVGLIICVERTKDHGRRVSQIVSVQGFDSTTRKYNLNVEN